LLDSTLSEVKEAAGESFFESVADASNWLEVSSNAEEMR
jgi:hypothetical protein